MRLERAAFALLSAFSFGVASAQATSTRETAYDAACCEDQGCTTATNHQRLDTAIVACLNKSLADGQPRWVQGGRYRIEYTAPTCTAPKPDDETRPQVCPEGTTGAWTQTRTYAQAAYPTCWTAGEWLPAVAPDGACVPIPPPGPVGVLYTDVLSAPAGAPATAYCADGTTAIVQAGTAATVCGVSYTLPTHAGRIWYVATSGNDATCQPDNSALPCRTPNALARSKAQAGDVIYVRAGQYAASDAANGWMNNNLARPNRSGTEAQPIAMLAYPGEVAEILLDRPYKIFGNYDQISDWTIAGFRVVLAHTQNSGVAMVGPPVSPAACANPASVQGYAQRIRIVGLDIDGRDTGGMAGGSGGDLIEVGTSRDVKVLGNYIHNTSPANPAEPTHAIYLSAPQQNTEVGWNRIQNIPHSRALIQFHQDSFAGACWGADHISGIKLHDNLVDNVAGQALLIDGGVGAVEAWNNTFTRIHLPDDHRYGDVVALRSSGNRLQLDFHDNVIAANPNYTDAGYIFNVGNPAHVACPMSLTFVNNKITLTGEASDVFVYRESWCASAPTITGTGNVWAGGTPPAVTPGP